MESVGAETRVKRVKMEEVARLGFFYTMKKIYPPQPMDGQLTNKTEDLAYCGIQL